MTFSSGDECIVTCGERTVDGLVVIISENQISAVIEFEAMLGGHVGMMPVFAQTSTDAARGIYRSIIDGTVVVLSRKQ
jgi:hypothetical protein